jgi:hypothetical protein
MQLFILKIEEIFHRYALNFGLYEVFISTLIKKLTTTCRQLSALAD